MEIKIPIKALTVNRAWAGRRFKSAEYKQFEIDVCKLLKTSKPREGVIQIHYKFFIKNFGNSDVDNMIKPIQDILVKRGYIKDDRKIIQIVAEKYRSNDERIEILIKML